MKNQGEADTRRVVRQRSENLCERCGRFGTTVHHRKKRGQGGPWTPSNCVALCGHGTTGCHGWVENFPDDAALEGWHVRPWQDEFETSVVWWRAGGRRVLLNLDGSTELEDLDPAGDAA